MWQDLYLTVVDADPFFLTMILSRSWPMGQMPSSQYLERFFPFQLISDAALCLFPFS